MCICLRNNRQNINKNGAVVASIIANNSASFTIYYEWVSWSGIPCGDARVREQHMCEQVRTITRNDGVFSFRKWNNVYRCQDAMVLRRRALTVLATLPYSICHRSTKSRPHIEYDTVNSRPRAYEITTHKPTRNVCSTNWTIAIHSKHIHTHTLHADSFGIRAFS